MRIDLGTAQELKEVITWSRHGDVRAPQSYQLYAAAGTEAGFSLEPAENADPAASGWKLLETVDTRKAHGTEGGAYAVTVPVDSASAYRYLLLVVSRVGENRFAQTFFNEVDVIAKSGPPLEYAPAPVRVLKTFPSADGRYQYTVDATEAPALMPWVEEKLMPVVQEWYPRTVDLLASKDYTAPAAVLLEFKNDMKGVPAYAMGATISLNAPWFEREKEREARGCVVHEMVHVVQNYWRARITNPRPTRSPGWVVEGIPDYIRWFLYEPESKGAGISAAAWPKAKYNDSYRVSANFIDWVLQTHGKEVLGKLNAACREGRYDDALWKEATGLTLEQLGEEWRTVNGRRLGLAP